MPREPLDTHENLPKELARQVASRELQGELPREIHPAISTAQDQALDPFRLGHGRPPSRWTCVRERIGATKAQLTERSFSAPPPAARRSASPHGLSPRRGR